MSKKINKDQLKKVSGGDALSDEINNLTYTCKNPKCGKTFKHANAVYKNGDFYCPYCGAFYKPGFPD